MKKLILILAVFLVLFFFSIAIAGKKKTQQIDSIPPQQTTTSSPLSVDHVVGVYTFAQPRHSTFVNGYIEFFPDHRWTMVVHFDDDNDRITDRHEVIRGIYEVRKVGGEPAILIHQEGKQDAVIKNPVFAKRKVGNFEFAGFGFTRKSGMGNYFDHALNVAQTAKSLRIETDPPGAAVYLDGVRVSGHTPLVVERPPAGRQINLRIDMIGYSSKKDTIQLEPDQSETLTYKLLTGQAELWIATKPWTRVTLDGKYKGDAPIKLTGLTAGNHTVSLANPGAGIEDSFEIELPEQEIVKKKIEYTGTLDIFIGKDAEIVDRKGKVIGNAPMQGLKLPVGNHTLRLVDADKKIKILTIRIKLDQVTTVNTNWDELKDWKK